MSLIDGKGQAFYGGGWQPEAYQPSEKSWADSSPHIKVATYQVVRNDATAYSWCFDPLGVLDKDYKLAWEGDPATVEVSIEKGCIVLKNPGEETGAYLKLPKTANPNGELKVDRPMRSGRSNGLFVSVSKMGATAPMESLPDWVLGTTPKVVMEAAIPLEEELAEIGRKQAERAAAKAA